MKPGSCDNNECAAQVGKTVQHIGELYTDQYANGQGIDEMRKSVPAKAERVNNVQPIKGSK